MRKIKFKFWNVKHKCFEEANFKEIYAHMLYGGKDGKEYVPLQYTGKKDYNEKEIYDGDILEYISKNKKPRHPYNLVIWDDLHARWSFEVIGKKIHPHEKNIGRKEILGMTNTRLKDYTNGGHYIIVGNKFENPELLKYTPFRCY